ncbi:MAG: molybdopterin-guanine dinucleotide biosynthesis protein B [Deltaproteobacteria bacterium]|nr:molybdopterin-guanine dinucleotide biosynthesis protein B [Deltaproteobacteria bacterium]
MDKIPLLGFIGPSNSGKTTLLTALIAALTAAGLRIGAVKHHHRPFTIDHQGKDSQRFTAAGARKTVITGPRQTALIELSDRQIELEELAENYLQELDLILVEGFKQKRIPKIEVQRQALDLPLLSRGDFYDPNLIAVISDCEQSLDVPLFQPQDLGAITTFITSYFALSAHPDRHD